MKQVELFKLLIFSPQWPLTGIASHCRPMRVEVVHLNPLTTFVGLIWSGKPTSIGSIYRSRSIFQIRGMSAARLAMTNVGKHSNASAKGSIVRPGRPRPASASADWKMIPSKSEPSGGDSQDGASEDVEPEMVKVRISRR